MCNRQQKPLKLMALQQKQWISYVKWGYSKVDIGTINKGSNRTENDRRKWELPFCLHTMHNAVVAKQHLQYKISALSLWIPVAVFLYFYCHNFAYIDLISGMGTSKGFLANSSTHVKVTWTIELETLTEFFFCQIWNLRDIIIFEIRIHVDKYG